MYILIMPAEFVQSFLLLCLVANKLEFMDAVMFYNFSLQMYATAELSLMVTYNALARGTWEPILEPITDPKDDQAPQSMWSLKFDVS